MNPRIHKEIIKCGKDPNYFIKNYCKISHPKKGQIPFGLYPFQEKCINDFRKNRFNIILKARQMGISTLCASYVVWLCLFHKSKEVVIVATTQRVSQKLIKKCKTVLKNLPKWIFLTKLEYSTKTFIEFENGSSITAVPTSPDAGRSDSLSLLVIDEAAFIRDFDEIYTSSYSTLSTGGDMIVLSTPNGVSNLYYQLYAEADEGKNDFNPIKLMWDLHPERDQTWFEKETRNMRPHQIAQELLCNFNASSKTLLDPYDLESLKEMELNPFRKTGPANSLWVWKSPVPGHRYILSCDVARGDREDFSAFHIIDRNENEVVAEFHERISTDEFAKFINKVGRDFNTALVIPENNIYGHAVIKDLKKLKYPNVYHAKNKYVLMQDYNPIVDGKEDYGFNTNGHNRDAILMNLRNLIEKRALKIYSSRLYNEFLTFTWDGSKYKASAGSHDDLILSLAIGCSIIIDADTTQTTTLSMEDRLKGISVESVSFNEIPNTGKDVGVVPSVLPIQQTIDIQKQTKKISRQREFNDFSWLLRN